MLFGTPLQCLKLRNACAGYIPFSAFLECRINFHLKIAHLAKMAEAVETKKKQQKSAELCIISEVQAQNNNQLGDISCLLNVFIHLSKETLHIVLFILTKECGCKGK